MGQNLTLITMAELKIKNYEDLPYFSLMMMIVMLLDKLFTRNIRKMYVFFFWGMGANKPMKVVNIYVE